MKIYFKEIQLWFGWARTTGIVPYHYMADHKALCGKPVKWLSTPNEFINEEPISYCPECKNILIKLPEEVIRFYNSNLFMIEKDFFLSILKKVYIHFEIIHELPNQS